ncbi:Uncharacterised protein [Mycobacterium tuberculosis]|uniref:Uncharacterized protein n=1 Tax=Mycobacterium tuberculosis TaxID=1773 RepID=A0A654TRQ6_MYCTX|nr:Uncharacterised protein [Mycobacterium tuberculosis]CKS12916.1 Uncharacterised protein [Mycobacterium tuberculosis]COW43978.1 Uncharacterised protein [Mycobacterium tuberculosis]COY07098.1 Uncharacterised protein [Mycobacterium tuberculosis]
MHHRILGDALLVGGDCAGLVGRHRGHGHFLRPPDHRLGGGGVRVVAAAPTAPGFLVRTCGRGHREARRSRCGALARRVSGRRNRAHSPTIHADGHRRRASPHRRHAGHRTGGGAPVGALSRLGGRYRLSRLPRRQYRSAGRGESVSAGDRDRPGAGEPPDLDRAARRPGTHPQIGAAPR